MHRAKMLAEIYRDLVGTESDDTKQMKEQARCRQRCLVCPKVIIDTSSCLRLDMQVMCASK